MRVYLALVTGLVRRAVQDQSTEEERSMGMWGTHPIAGEQKANEDVTLPFMLVLYQVQPSALPASRYIAIGRDHTVPEKQVS